MHCNKDINKNKMPQLVYVVSITKQDIKHLNIPIKLLD